MCRFVGYIGREILLSELLVSPANSLIHQSYGARERREPLNGDGFGIGWYGSDQPAEPALFKSITPAWNNQNLLELSRHILSGCFFAHIRAASPGMPVSDANCHPFRIGQYLWMHNGTIEGFRLIRRRLCDSLPDRLYDSIQGTTDSEHAFAVFMNNLGDDTALTARDLGSALIDTISQIEKWVRRAGVTQPSIYNFAVTDGQNIATVRYVSSANTEPISLYFSKPGEYCYRDGKPMIRRNSISTGMIVASERLTDERDDWVRVAPNHVLTIDNQLSTEVRLMAL